MGLKAKTKAAEAKMKEDEAQFKTTNKAAATATAAHAKHKAKHEALEKLQGAEAELVRHLEQQKVDAQALLDRVKGKLASDEAGLNGAKGDLKALNSRIEKHTRSLSDALAKLKTAHSVVGAAHAALTKDEDKNKKLSTKIQSDKLLELKGSTAQIHAKLKQVTADIADWTGKINAVLQDKAKEVKKAQAAENEVKVETEKKNKRTENAR